MDRMEIDNNTVLEFLEVLSKEPIIWDPKDKNNKNRPLVAAAWERIQNALSEHHPVEMLKRKKNSLMTQYRECLRKIRDSSINASRPEEVHQPSWFAFDVMHEFLGPIYQNRPTFNTEIYLFPESHDEADEKYKSPGKWPPIREKIVETKDYSDDSSSQSDSINEELPSPASPPSLPPPAKIKKTKASNVRKRPISVRPSQESSKEREDNLSDDECDIYGKLVAMKLKKLEHEDRLRLMNDIDNLVYKHMMSVRTCNRPCSSTS